MKRLTLLLMSLAASATLANAAAYNWTYASSDNTATGSGTFSTLADGNVTSVSGTFNSWSITGLVPSLGQAPDVEGSWYRGPSDFQILFGLANGYSAGIKGQEMGPHDPPMISAMAYDSSKTYVNWWIGLSFNVTPLSPVPEPGEWTAIAFGVLGVVYVAKRRLMPAVR